MAEKKGSTIDYHLTILVANIVVLVLDGCTTFFTFWGIVRSQWLWIGLPVIEALPSALDYVILTTLLSELAEPGTDELLRMVLTSVSFLAASVGLVFTKFMEACLDVTNRDIANDTKHVRAHASIVFLIAYTCQLLLLTSHIILPRTRGQIYRWKLTKTTSSSCGGTLLLVVLVVSLFGSVLVHIFSVYEATSCLWVTGGQGCG